MIKQEIYKASTGKQIVMVGRPELLSQSLPSFRYRLSVVHRKYLNVSEQNCNVYWSKVWIQLTPKLTLTLCAHARRMALIFDTFRRARAPHFCKKKWNRLEYNWIKCDKTGKSTNLNTAKLVRIWQWKHLFVCAAILVNGKFMQVPSVLRGSFAFSRISLLPTATGSYQ